MIGKRVRHIGRYHEIAASLLRHGFGMIVDELGFSSFLSLPPRWLAFFVKQARPLVGEKRYELFAQPSGRQVRAPRAALVFEPLLHHAHKPLPVWRGRRLFAAVFVPFVTTWRRGRKNNDGCLAVRFPIWSTASG